MSATCPRACSRLASAAVFMSVGVVQFVVGIILLRSKYVFLLAGPDFWTSSCNIAVGCLLGVSASVWKHSRKRESKKHVIRRHLLFALMFSGFILNATTLMILLLGEGNTLLSIRLESDGKYNETTFASEVLAYAYVTSVCCPVVCIVISIVGMSGSCFSSARRNSIERKISNSLKKNRSLSLPWVYAQERPHVSKNKSHESVLSVSSVSSSDYDSDVPVQQKYTKSVDELHRVLSRMAQGKRDDILSDSTVMLRQLDLRRKNRYNSLNPDGSYLEPVLVRVKESTAGDKSLKPSLTLYCDSDISETGNPIRYSSELDEDACFPPGDVSLKRISRSRNKRPDMQHRNEHAKKFIEYQDNSQSAVKSASSQYRNFRGKLPEMADNIVGYSSDATDYNSNRNAAATHKKSRKILAIETKDFGEKSVSTKPSHRRKSKESSPDNHQMIREKTRRQLAEVKKPQETCQDLNDCFSPDGSDFSPETPFESVRTRSSWAGEMVPISVNNSSALRLSHKLIPVASPVIPNPQEEHDPPKLSDDSGISSTQSNSFNSEMANQSEFKGRESNLSSFRENPKTGNKENMQEYPKAGSQSIKKYDLSRVLTMASISEEPNLELNPSEQKAHCSSLSETSPKTSRGYIRQQSLPAIFPQSPNRDAQRNEGSSEINGTPRRKRSASGKALKKLWSLAVSDSHSDFLDQVVDDDSLIGLSEEELIARQLKNRSLRKAVQQRIKEEMMV